MRKIKFRCWNGKEMLKVASINFGDDGSALTVTFEPAPKKAYYNPKVHGESGELMEFTGFTDKNDLDVYEMDILKDMDGNIGIIMFDDTNFCFSIFWENEKKYGFAVKPEVIGNFYQNNNLVPEILYPNRKK